MSKFTGYTTSAETYGGDPTEYEYYPERPRWEDHFDNDREAGEDSPQEQVDDLIAELENIRILMDDGKWDDASDELECQSGRIQAIKECLG